MTDQNYRVASCEGGDQVGKADAILNLRKQLIKKSIPVTYSSFPIYATPVGTAIRMFLKNGISIPNTNNTENTAIKMSLFSLNRLEFLDVLLSSDIYSKTLVLLDRSSFSNAVTIAYTISSDKECEEGNLEKLVDLALDLDSLMIRKLNLEECVIELVSECKDWGNIRSEKRDLYEHRDVQLLSNGIYKIYAKKIGKGWGQIVTKDDKGWRERGDILKDVVEKIGKSFGEIRPNRLVKNREVGVEEIMRSLYPGSFVNREELEIYKKSLYENDKDTMYEYACKLGLAIANSCDRVEFQNKEVKRAFKEITNRYPKVYDVLLQCVGDKYVKRLQEGLR